MESQELPLGRYSRHFPLVRSPEFQADFDVSGIQAGLDRIGRGQGKDLTYYVIQYMARRQLPYGRWTCEDGREVIFNREYLPILQRKDGVVTYADRTEWVDNETIVKGEYFYDDSNNPMLYLCKHLGQGALSPADTRASKKSLLICLRILKEYMAPERYLMSGYNLRGL